MNVQNFKNPTTMANNLIMTTFSTKNYNYIKINLCKKN